MAGRRLRCGDSVRDHGGAAGAGGGNRTPDIQLGKPNALTIRRHFGSANLKQMAA